MAKEIQPAQVFEDVLAAAAKMPGVHIDREPFLRSSLKKYCDDATIDKAVEDSPAAANIPLATIKRLANDSINYETAKVTAISTAAGIPGGLAMLGTVPADTAQYFAHVLRIAQKLANPDSYHDGEYAATREDAVEAIEAEVVEIIDLPEADVDATEALPEDGE